MLALFAVPLAAILATALVYSSLRVARVWLSRPSLVVAGAAVVAHTQLLLLFELLGALRLFRLPAVLLACVAIAFATRRMKTTSLDVGAWFKSLGPTARVLLVAALAVAALKMLRAMVAPTLATDATIYHVPRAAMWVREAGFARFGAPDAMEMTDFYPPGGDVPWTYALLIARNESLIGVASIAIFLEVLVGTYAALRSLGAERNDAVLGALLVGFTPAVFVYAGSAYVDVAVLAYFCCGIAIVLSEGPSFGRALLASLAFTLAASAKISAALVIPFVLLTTRDRRWFLGFALGALPIVPHLVRSTLARGSPVYPVGLSLFGRTIFPPNETFELLVTARMYVPPKDDPVAFLGILLHPWPKHSDTTGFGPVLVALLVLAAVGFWRERRWPLLGIAAVFLGSVWGPGALAYRTGFAAHTARNLTIAVAALVLLAARSRVVWIACVVVSLVLSFPRGFGALDASALVLVAPAFAFAGAMLFLRRHRTAAFAVALWAAHVLTLGVRAEKRDAYLAALESRAIYDIHPTGAVPRGTARVWQHIDRMAPSRIAVAAGWNGEGMHWFLSPLLGREQQHTLLWVTPTRDGSVVDYRRGAELAARMDYDAWRTRLREQRVSLIVCIAPSPPERAWIDAHPESFEPLVASDSGRYAAFRVRD